MMAGVLITGFEPFGGETVNPSWEVVKQLEKILFDQYRDPHLAVKPKALEGRG
ncbi:hypothetical protein JTL96_37540, partial [Pseudomonas aeruginosa]|nr:hypothetical protein [Pseudomonas aeruginosa]